MSLNAINEAMEEEEVYLSKDEYDRMMRLHSAYPIPAIKRGMIKLVCTDDIEVKEEVITPLPDMSPPKKSPGSRGVVSPALWDVGNVVELSPEVTKITLSISELRDKIKGVSNQRAD